MTIESEDDVRSAPRLAYDFPGATCISINEEAAHGSAQYEHTMIATRGEPIVVTRLWPRPA